MEIVRLHTNHSEYSALEAAKHSITVDELIEYLGHFRGSDKVIFINDGGYTYGYVNDNYISDREYNEEED